jgi:hypothetical protein
MTLTDKEKEELVDQIAEVSSGRTLLGLAEILQHSADNLKYIVLGEEGLKEINKEESDELDDDDDDVNNVEEIDSDDELIFDSDDSGEDIELSDSLDDEEEDDEDDSVDYTRDELKALSKGNKSEFKQIAELYDVKIGKGIKTNTVIDSIISAQLDSPIEDDDAFVD